MPADLTDRLLAVRDEADRLAADDAFSGVLHVQRGDQVLLTSAHGVASRRWSAPVTTRTRFDIASVTKLFTSVAVLQQVDAGTLDLDASIHRYVDLTGTTVSPDVTLRHLLSHTSGIADDADEEAGESYEALWVDRPTYSVTETADFLPQFVHKTPVFAPGAGCRYCNVGYVLAGLAVERVSGERYRDVVVRDVLGRARMHDSGFFDMREAVPDVAEGWEPVRDDEDGPVVGWRQNIFSYPPIGSPDGGAHSTAADLVRFLDAVRAGELLSEASTAAFLAPHALHHTVDDPRPGGPAAVHFAFGLEIETTPQGTVRSLSKDGINVGASAIVRHYPAQDVTLAVVSNSEGGAWGPIRLLDAAVLPA
ncbi:serine hydrolase domain-containing protein [Cellulomonas soli]|uniref:Serine hydrolase n=1 Tax=Cellulomonas soli TaxID=931535 RepID=A0A512PGM0_9CELL|nr:serine hydrolase domain-containing protein [Cellulomonas soli]NYI58208.1 CubicO group peptidase (beta-lactamase class C family) [Cellulomonas soli]GEP70340.1 serine hydrolase [Cellulomonas soli]